MAVASCVTQYISFQVNLTCQPELDVYRDWHNLDVCVCITPILHVCDSMCMYHGICVCMCLHVSVCVCMCLYVSVCVCEKNAKYEMCISVGIQVITHFMLGGDSD